MLLEHVLLCELHMTVQVLQPGRLAIADELVVDEAILDIVELVHVLHNGLTLIPYKVLDESISADGNPKSIVAVNLKRHGREQGTEVHEGGICNEQAMCSSVRISHRDTLYENLGLVIQGLASVLLENLLDVREHLQRDGQLGFDVAIIRVCYSAGVLVVLGEVRPQR